MVSYGRHFHLRRGRVIFAAQNLQIVTISFLRFGIRMPLPFLVAGIYAVGMLTGGSLMTLLRQSMQGAKRPAARAP